MLNSTLLNAAQNVINSPSNCYFNVTAKFINSQAGSTFTWFPLRMGNLLIDRDYLENYGDIINLDFSISPHDYAMLQDQGQNLLCLLTLTYVNSDGKIVFTPSPVQKQYNVLILDPRDVRLLAPDVHNYTEPSLTMKVRLVESTIYRLRHLKLNTIYQNMTITQVVHTATNFYGIERLHLVPPDNSHQYDHVVIPSYQGIDSLYGWLQQEYGVYTKGCNSYLTDGVLYIYPPFETAPVYDKTVIFYQVDTGRFSGSPVYHKVDGKNLSVVIQTQPESYDLSIAGAENHGTGFIFTRASRLTDGFTTVNTQSGAQFTENPSLSVTLANSRTVEKDLNNLQHVKATDNPFPHMSELIYHQASLMKVHWRNADPFQLDPGHAIKYYYDQNGSMVLKTGIVEKATYEFKVVAKKGALPMYGVVAELILRLSPNTTMVL